MSVVLFAIGEDPAREGLRGTPDRVARAWCELTAGYDEDPAAILECCFAGASDEMVVLRGISFYSTCEHHLLPFYGTAAVGYLPGARGVVGISKLARLVNCYARRLQIQERMTTEIANAVRDHLGPLGVGVVVRAHHLCMGCRGVMQPASEMVTSAMYGRFRESDAARAEFMRLASE